MSFLDVMEILKNWQAGQINTSDHADALRFQFISPSPSLPVYLSHTHLDLGLSILFIVDFWHFLSRGAFSAIFGLKLIGFSRSNKMAKCPFEFNLTTWIQHWKRITCQQTWTDQKMQKIEMIEVMVSLIVVVDVVVAIVLAQLNSSV